MDDLYDEFGNYLGGAESEEEEQPQHGQALPQSYNYDFDSEEEEEAGAQAEGAGNEMMDVDEGPSNAVILHEDKQYYPTATQLYGPTVETLVEEEDAQPLTQPIIAPPTTKRFAIQESGLPPVRFSRTFMADLQHHPAQVRNVALAGHLHHGKTALLDALVLQTHELDARLARRTGRSGDEQLRYTDTTHVERERGVSVKCAPMTLVLPDSRGKSYLVNILDTPGHTDFVDEVAAALRLADGVAVVVDVVEGVQANTEQIVRHAASQGLPLTLVLNKLDRLILELKLPPADAYFKLKHVVEEVNNVIARALPGQDAARCRLSPERGNVAFACASMRWCFTLPSFARLYAARHDGGLDAAEFARRLWGDVFYDPARRKCVRGSGGGACPRAFVHFVLEPIYKLYAAALGRAPAELRRVLARVGVAMAPAEARGDARAVLRAACGRFFGPLGGFVDMVVAHIPSPDEGAERYLERYYTGPLDTALGRAMAACDADGPLVVHVTKLLATQDGAGFDALGRVVSGTARAGEAVRVLGEGYSEEDEEDACAAVIGATWVSESRYRVALEGGVPAGNWVLLGGVDASVVKTATVVGARLPAGERASVFRPLAHMTESVFKVAVEPVNPSELPKMLDGLRRVNKAYPLARTKVEESGEHVVLGTGELYMDCVLHDLRRVYAEMDLKVSDPVTRFCETVVETSAIMSYAVTPNGKNKVTMVAEPLDEGIAEDIEQGRVKIRDPVRKVAKFFEENYEWDKLAARSIWAFGPEEMGPNILVDDTLPSQVDKKVLGTVRESIRQGFWWGTREGPLCEEPIRNTKFRLTDITLAPQAILRGGGQLIPTTRRAIYSSFLMASPRLMEPLYACHMLGPADAVAAIYKVLARRRGHVVADGPVAGTPLYSVRGLLPVIDSFGFETDLRIHTQGAAGVSLVFDRWSVVPGDPLDRGAKVRPLEVAGAMATARDFVVKTRRRKGLSEDVTVGKFLEPELVRGLRESGVLE